jgi:hypothetical protein
MNGEWIAEREREIFKKYKNTKEVYLVAAGLEI